MIARALACAAFASLAFGAGPDRALYTAEMLTLRTALSNELSAIDTRLRELQANALREALREWEAELAERRRTRNIRGIAIAEDARTALQRMLDELEKRGHLQWPPQMRRELVEYFTTLRERLEAAERSAAADKAAHEDRAIDRFRTAADRAGADLPADPDALRALFRTWLREPPPPSQPHRPTATDSTPATPPLSTAAAPTAAAATALSPSPIEPPEFFAQSRAGADWKTVGTWKADSAGPDVFEISVFRSAGLERGERQNPILGRTTTWSWHQVQEVSPGMYSWRLRRVGSADVVTVIEWPSPANQGRLMFRTRIPARIPSETAFEVQYSSAQLVSLELNTDPPGAWVEINGQRYREGVADVRTPCTIHVTPGTIALKLSLDGYEDAVAPALRVVSNRVISIKLTPVKGLPVKSVTVDPQTIWTESGITVRRGDRIRLSVAGEWSCGTKGEMTGPQGYDPRDLRFSHYYLQASAAAKQHEMAPYGALLARIGTNPIIAVGQSASFIAEAEGPLFFDINEAPDPALRRNNRGALKVSVIVTPGSAP